MGDGTTGAVGGAIVGLCAVFLLQQLALVDLSRLIPGLELLLLGALVGALLFGLVGRTTGSPPAKRAGPPAQSAKPAAGPTAEPPEEPDPRPAEDQNAGTVAGASAPTSTSSGPV